VPPSAPTGFYQCWIFAGNRDRLQICAVDTFLFDKVLDGAAAAAPELSFSASPNPFNPTTTLAFSLPTGGPLEVAIYNSSGQKVATLANGYRVAGLQQMTWDAGGLPSGVYFACLQTPAKQQIQKLLLLK
jgi:hypothetical protein